MDTDCVEVPPVSDRKYMIDTVYMKHPRKDMELATFLKDGMGWFLFEAVFVGLACSICQMLRFGLSYHTLLNV